jgi:hypothetical protein
MAVRSVTEPAARRLPGTVRWLWVDGTHRTSHQCNGVLASVPRWGRWIGVFRLTPLLGPTYHPPDDDAPRVLWGTGAFACL